MAWGASPGERRGGRAKGTPNKATVERQREVAAALAHAAALRPNLTFEQAMNLRALDVMRTTQAMYAMAGEWAKAAAWAKEIAPYETAKLAPKPEEPPAETDEERAFRLRSAVMEMRQTVGGEATETVEDGEQPADPTVDTTSPNPAYLMSSWVWHLGTARARMERDAAVSAMRPE